MPYIPQDRRDELLFELPQNKGELNYRITRAMHIYIGSHGMSYQVISDAIGAAIDAAEECRRVVLGPYEDIKRKENGAISKLDKL
jgi:hypothetical protein